MWVVPVRACPPEFRMGEAIPKGADSALTALLAATATGPSLKENLCGISPCLPCYFTQRLSSLLYTFFDYLDMLVYCLLISISLFPPGIPNLSCKFYTYAHYRIHIIIEEMTQETHLKG